MGKKNGFTIGYCTLAILCALTLVFISACNKSDGKKWRGPAAPTVDTVTSPTNVSPITLTGGKPVNTSIWIDDAEAVALDDTETWSAQFTPVEGENIISVTAKLSAGTESEAVLVTIEYDSTPPANPTSFTATGTGGQISLSWSNPTAADFYAVTIRGDAAATPAGPADGAGIYYAAGTSVVDSPLTNYAYQYYAAFSSDSLGNYSSGNSLVAFAKGPAGTLDTTFNTSGFTSHDNAAGGAGIDKGNAIILDGSGKLLVVGSSSNGANDDMALWRYNNDGSLDTTFGGDVNPADGTPDGFVIHHNAAVGNDIDRGIGITLDGSGKILVTGVSSNGANFDLALWRFNSDGSLDTTFGPDVNPTDGTPDGFVIHHNAAGGNGGDIGNAVIVDGSGKIIVAGKSQKVGNYEMALWRFNSDGSLDTTFNTVGFVVHGNAAGADGTDVGEAVILDGSGKILVVGNSSGGTGSDMALWRFNPDGSLDTTFNTVGFVIHNNAAGGNGGDAGKGLVLDGSGKILVTGDSHNGTDADMVLWRFNSDGTLDTTFVSNGFVTHHSAAGGTSHDYGKAIVLDGSGKILVTGYSNNSVNNDMVIWRFNPNGSLDTTFDTDGFAIHDNAAGGAANDFGQAMALDGFGRIVVTGRSIGVAEDLAIWRYNN